MWSKKLGDHWLVESEISAVVFKIQESFTLKIDHSVDIGPHNDAALFMSIIVSVQCRHQDQTVSSFCGDTSW